MISHSTQSEQNCLRAKSKALLCSICAQTLLRALRRRGVADHFRGIVRLVLNEAAEQWIGGGKDFHQQLPDRGDDVLLCCLRLAFGGEDMVRRTKKVLLHVCVMGLHG